jgi:hypothetical protein
MADGDNQRARGEEKEYSESEIPGVVDYARCAA